MHHLSLTSAVGTGTRARESAIPGTRLRRTAFPVRATIREPVTVWRMITKLIRELPQRAVSAVLGLLDRSPFTPQGLARRKLDRLDDRRSELAASDPRWQQIQELRGPDGLTYLSDKVGPADWQEQLDIERRLLPDPWWVRPTQMIAGFSLQERHRLKRSRRQRARRGWSDADAWNLDTNLCRTLSEQLAHLAHNGHGWPGEHSEWPTPQAWQSELLRHSASLGRYHNDPEVDDAVNRWYELYVTREADPAAEAAASQHHIELERRNTEGAKASLHWVADNLESLWD